MIRAKFGSDEKKRLRQQVYRKVIEQVRENLFISTTHIHSLNMVKWNCATLLYFFELVNVIPREQFYAISVSKRHILILYLALLSSEKSNIQ